MPLGPVAGTLVQRVQPPGLGPGGWTGWDLLEVVTTAWGG